METILLSDTETDLERAAAWIQAGEVVGMPTETVYGLAADACNPEAVKKVFAAKGRPADNPLIVHIAEMQALEQVAAVVPPLAVKLAERFWPGPLTMILPKSEEVPFETTGGLNTVAIRFPSHKTAQALIAYGGGYVAAPSANTSGRPSPSLARHVQEDLNGKIDMIIDGGEVEIGIESTIVDLTVEPPQILRPGYVTQEMLSRVLGEVDTDVTILSDKSGQAPKAPGMKYRHYAPKGQLTIVAGTKEKVAAYINEETDRLQAQGVKTGVIATEETKNLYHADVVKCAGSRTDELSVAKHLYGILRDFDEEGTEKMFSESFDYAGIGQAVMNRLLKAAGHHVVQV